MNETPENSARTNSYIRPSTKLAKKLVAINRLVKLQLQDTGGHISELLQVQKMKDALDVALDQLHLDREEITVRNVQKILTQESLYSIEQVEQLIRDYSDCPEKCTVPTLINDWRESNVQNSALLNIFLENES